jgi:hypothetical protein
MPFTDRPRKIEQLAAAIVPWLALSRQIRQQYRQLGRGTIARWTHFLRGEQVIHAISKQG